MNKNPLVKKSMHVVVLGLGVTGASAIRYLHSLGAKVYVSDTRTETQLSPEQLDLLNIYCHGFEGGGHSESFLERADLIFISPGIPANLQILQNIKDAGIKVVGELALAAPVLQSKVIAITGTNGKTTVTTLVGDLMRETGKEVFVGGNIGNPLLECLMQEKQPEIAVLEVSSFQLENAGDFRPEIGVILNITPDHIDWHGSIADYIRAKVKIFGNQQKTDKAIICTDNVICMELADHLSGSQPVLFGHTKTCNGYICESEIYVRWQDQIEKYDLSETVFDNHIGRLNCAAAILAARYGGCEKHSIDKVLRNFNPLPHRMEEVAIIDGVIYCNDSKATNTGAVVSALTQANGKVILIAGGRDKGDDYSLLREAVAKKVRKLILIGESAEKIGNEIGDIVSAEYVTTMDDAVSQACIVAQSGDTVLLSPACASFDMFNSYADRGRAFRESVKKLQQIKENALAAGGQ